MSTATDMRDIYLAAEADILQNGFSTRIGERQLTMADLPSIRAGRQEWERRAAAEQATSASGRMGFAVATFADSASAD